MAETLTSAICPHRYIYPTGFSRFCPSTQYPRVLISKHIPSQLKMVVTTIVAVSLLLTTIPVGSMLYSIYGDANSSPPPSPSWGYFYENSLEQRQSLSYDSVLRKKRRQQVKQYLQRCEREDALSESAAEEKASNLEQSSKRSRSSVHFV
ncbi:hypothetical protein Cob_v008055 [Colletotrichum orbiculare MAFF 240422]|uniref:Uncharacterized protein n=1 Tax=Colletotrichum orbiculare (strain 104-T / ATCC 96160 / CBS 514.97 / LARS 414 / MAFF 240422) TaxID=1213857 RepID=A0A484FPS8_COLOR|nr:hypothetical protein Cob_v008055 [Colletotrichum orbiculare MAFF 240422]